METARTTTHRRLSAGHGHVGSGRRRRHHGNTLELTADRQFEGASLKVIAHVMRHAQPNQYTTYIQANCLDTTRCYAVKSSQNDSKCEFSLAHGTKLKINE